MPDSNETNISNYFIFYDIDCLVGRTSSYVLNFIRKSKFTNGLVIAIILLDSFGFNSEFQLRKTLIKSNNGLISVL